MDYEPTKPVDAFCVLRVSGVLNLSCSAVAPSTITCQHEKRNSKYALLSYHADHYMTSGLQYNEDKKEKHLLNHCSGMTAEHIYFISALVISF